MTLAFDVKTQGVDQLINRLKGFEPEVYKALQQETKAAAMLVGQSARNMIPTERPLSHWGPGGRLGWDSGKVKSGIKPGFRSKQYGRVRYVSAIVRSTNAAGVLYMASGSKDNGRLGAFLSQSHGNTFPRALGPAWTMHVDAAREAIQDAINRAAERVTNG